MPPVYFPAAYFPALMALRGDSGARALLQRHAAEVTAVPVADLGDLDTPSDYEAYLDGQAKGVSGG
jgi:molybdenum cofactor cytidylyltransferase